MTTTADKDLIQKAHQIGMNRTRVLIESEAPGYQGLCPKCHHGWVYCNDQGCACDYCGWIPPR